MSPFAAILEQRRETLRQMRAASNIFAAVFSITFRGSLFPALPVSRVC